MPRQKHPPHARSSQHHHRRLSRCRQAVSRHGFKPKARIIACAAVGCDPALMRLGPVGAIRRVCVQTGWSLDQVDVIEINEAFAEQTLGCMKELGLDSSRVNPRGGASSARVLVTLLHHLEDHSLRRGIASLCIGSGMSIAMALELEA